MTAGRGSAAHATGATGEAERMRASRPEELAQMRLAQAKWLREQGRLAEAQALEREPLQ